MSKTQILIVEDDADIRELITYNLEREGYVVAQAASGEQAIKLIARRQPDLVLLDLMLPEMDGLEVCRKLKAEPKTRSLPIIIVSAKGEEPDVVTGLELGADDYVTKPFRPKELVARVRAVFRRKAQPSAERSEILRVQNLEIHTGRREVKVGGKPVDLTYTEFELLLALARRPGWVFTRYQIVDAVRGADYPVTDRAVDVQIVGLRKKLGKAAGIIETVRGVGYRFVDGAA